MAFHRKNITILFVLLFIISGFPKPGLSDQERSPDQLPGRFAGKGIVVGLEYVVFNNRRLVINMADAFAETGMTGMKHYPEAVQWNEMQRGPNRPIDFKILDMFVHEYQKRGFTELTLCLKPHSSWASPSARCTAN